jgi:hypothetical protein
MLQSDSRERSFSITLSSCCRVVAERDPLAPERVMLKDLSLPLSLAAKERDLLAVSDGGPCHLTTCTF